MSWLLIVATAPVQKHLKPEQQGMKSNKKRHHPQYKSTKEDLFLSEISNFKKKLIKKGTYIGLNLVPLS